MGPKAHPTRRKSCLLTRHFLVVLYFMNNKHRKTLEDIFADPVKSSITWADIESVFRAYGGEIREGSGSRVWFIFGQQVAVFHRPHPQPTTDKGAVKSVRRYFSNIGLKP